MNDAKLKLQKLMRRAYSGEMAAALAYQGHRKILKSENERKAVQQIEIDEWRHRSEIGEILTELNAKPSFLREAVFFSIGKFVSVSCFFTGRFISTYFAGKLENGNVVEYKEAFDLAKECDLEEFCEMFSEMRDTELLHERILFEMIENNRFLPLFAFIFNWGKTANFATESRDVKF